MTKLQGWLGFQTGRGSRFVLRAGRKLPEPSQSGTWSLRCGEQLRVADFDVVSGVVKATDRCGAAKTVLVTIVVRSAGSCEFGGVLRLRSPAAGPVEE